MRAAEISRTGLDVEWQRLQVIAQNIANMNTSQGVNGAPVRAMRLLSGPQGDFRTMVRSDVEDGTGAVARGVAVLGIAPVAGGVRRVYEPGHPQADPQGFVTYPAIDQAAEMALMIRTARAYEANLTALSLSQRMYGQALELGRQK